MAGHDWRWQRIAAQRLSRRAGLRTGALCAAGVAGAWLLACGGEKQESTGEAVTTGGQAQATAAQETPKPGGVLTQVFFTDPSPNFDLHQTTTYTTVWPVAPCFNQLVQFHPDKPSDTPQDIIPDLAEKWEQQDLSIVFSLRRDVKWHDDSGFTGEDVKATLEWIKKPFKPDRPSPRSGTQVTVDSIELPDPYTVKLNFSRPTPSYLMNVATSYYAVGQAKDLIENGEIGTGGKLVGTGPFKLKNYQRSNFVELEKNPTYHLQGQPYLDGVKTFILPDYTTRLTNFTAGQYHIIIAVELVKSDLEQIKQNAGDRIETFSIPGFTREPVFMNAARPPYNDIRVRQAINLAIDRDAAISVVKQGLARRGGYMAPHGVWTIGEAELRKFDGYDKPDIQKAKQLLSAAGVTTPLKASGTTRTDFKDYGEFVKDQLAKVGIDFNLTLADTATAQPVLIRGDFDIGPWTIAINVDDPDATFAEVATSKAARNWSRVYDDQIDQLYEKQSVTTDFEERKKLVQELEKRALSQYQIAVLYFQHNNQAMAKSVRDYTFHESLYANKRHEATWLKT
jgi:peptide/nickel transport system substrate-binding protein